MTTNQNRGEHTQGQLVFEDKTDCGAGLQIKGIIGDPVSRREFAEFRLKGDVPVPLFLVAYDQWMQFPNPEWREMQKANGRRLVACWNACQEFSTESLEASTRMLLSDPPYQVLKQQHEALQLRVTSLEGALMEFLKVTEPGIGMKGLSELPGRVDFYDRITDVRKMAQQALSPSGPQEA